MLNPFSRPRIHAQVFFAVLMAGSGLSGGGAQGSVALSVDSTVVQSRVVGSCGVGSSIRAVGQDGSVICDSLNETVATDIAAHTSAVASELSSTNAAVVALEARVAALEMVLGPLVEVVTHLVTAIKPSNALPDAVVSGVAASLDVAGVAAGTLLPLSEIWNNFEFCDHKWPPGFTMPAHGVPPLCHRASN